MKRTRTGPRSAGRFLLWEAAQRTLIWLAAAFVMGGGVLVLSGALGHYSAGLKVLLIGLGVVAIALGWPVARLARRADRRQQRVVIDAVSGSVEQ